MTGKVGPGRPPEHTRWKRGQSGNPRGRPKAAANLHDDVVAELTEPITITEQGRTRRITKRRAMVKRLAAEALKGNVRAANLLIGMCARAIEAQAGQAQGSSELSAADRKIVEDYLERQVQLRLAAQKGDK